MAHKYLIRRSDWFYFNKRIGNKVFRLSLQTRDIWTAKSIIKAIKQRIEGARVTIEIIKAVVQEEIDRVIDKVTAILQPQSKQAKSELTRYFHSHFTPNSLHNNQLDNVPFVEGLPDRKPILNLDDWIKQQLKDVDIPQSLKEYLMYEDPTLVYEKEFVEQEALITLLNKYVQALKTTDTTQLKPVVDNLKHSFNRDTVTQSQVYTTQSQQLQKKSFLSYNHALEKYKKDKNSYLYKNEKGKEIATKTITESLTWIEGLGSPYFGSTNIHDIDYSQFDEMLVTLTAFPKRKEHYKKMSMEECLDLARSGDTPEDARQDKQLGRVKSKFNRFFTWLYDTNILEENPITKSRFKRFTDLSSRGAFNKSELNKLRAYYDSLDLDDHGACFYMQLFGGMRNKEILAITLEDIRTDDDTGVLYFYIKGTKTDNAQRRVPIHKYLIDRGVVDYIKANNGFNISSEALSMMFTKLLRKLDIDNLNEQGELLSFYSLRHNFMTSLVSYGATDTMINAIVGHTQKGTKKDYISTHLIDLKQLNNVVQAIPN
ncbi:tyrosine-type recombinase/integrase [Vibrio casei]|uniref:tyrosine-type recombinase/integrase n=1 Tax=Vibrio casei TaxID=673372 RepID=UPI003F9DF4F3